MISFTTRNRPHVLEYSIRESRKHYGGHIVIIDDNSDTKDANQFIAKKYGCAYLYNETRQGIPRSKERGFGALRSYDHQFWFDDDCYLKEPLDRFKEAMEYQGHLLHLKPWAHIEVKKEYPEGLVSYTGATACFMSFRKDMYSAVKGFQVGHKLYGGWHHQLSIKMAQFGLDEYVALKDSPLHSFDIDGVPADFKYMFGSSLPQEERIKKKP